MTNTWILTLSLCSPIILLAIPGCSGGDKPQLAVVTGTVTVDDAPLPNAAVRFYPDVGQPSSGMTDEQGQYQLVYSDGARGAVLGKHVVRITTLNEEDDPLGVQSKEQIPAKYNKQTELSVEITAGENVHDFPLKSK